MTTAEEVARLFHDDGACWEAEIDGETRLPPDECVRQQGAHDRIARLECERWEFPDGSAIVAWPSGWDIEGDLLFGGESPACSANEFGAACMEEAAVFDPERGHRCERHREQDPEN